MSLEEQLADAVRQGNIPHAVVFASSRDGNFEYSYAVGKTSVEEGASDIQQNALFLLASQTKLVTAVAALQVVERGLIGLDDDVAALLPELARQPILKGFDDNDKPVLEERKARITLSNLLTHTAGTAYDAGNPDLIKFQSQHGIVPNSGLDVVSRFAYPLVYEPGEAWGYSTGIDWAGLVVERLTNSTLETFMKANIWDPLGLQSMTFFPSHRKGEEDRVPVLSARGPDGQLHPHKGPFINTGVTGCFGGSGMYSTMRDYLTFMQSLLVNDGKLLKPESVDELFKPRLTATQAKAHQEFSLSPMGKLFIGEFDWEKYKHGWSFGGLVFLQAYDDGRRREGAITWGGMANSFWLLDREAGLAITFGTQVIPPGDVGVRGAISLVEKGVYAMAGKSQTTISGRM